MDNTIVLPEQILSGFSLDPDLGYALHTNPAPFQLTLGEAYVVVWDEEPYLVTAEDASDFQTGSILLGNGTSVGLSGNGEPFAIGWSPYGVSYFAFLDPFESHKIGIYTEGIYLKNYSGEKEIHCGLEELVVDTTKGNEQPFTKGKLLENVSTETDFREGDMLLQLPEGYLAKGCIIKKPENLKPENIAEDIEVAGIVGTFKGVGDTVDKVVPLTFKDCIQVDTPEQMIALMSDSANLGKYVQYIGNDGTYPFEQYYRIEQDSAVVEADSSEIPLLDYQTIKADKGALLASATILKPETLVPENIAKGVEIGGVVGSFKGGGLMTDYIMGNITRIEDPDVTVVASTIFTRNSRLTEVVFPECSKVGEAAFYSCYNLSSVVLPRCTQISSSAFVQCAISEVDMPLVTDCASYAFYSCTSLTKVSLPAVTVIGSYAFQSCYKMSSIYAPLASNIGGSAFRYCSSLTEVNLPGCKSIGAYAFANCPNLSSVNMPSLTYIGGSAFMSTKLTTAVFPECTTLGTSAFFGCSEISMVSFNKLTALPYSAFQSWSKLVSAYLPSCRSMGQYPFSGCNSLQYLYVGNSAAMYSQVLSNAALNQHLTVNGNGVWWSYAFRYCKARKITFTCGGTLYPYMFAYNSYVKDIVYNTWVSPWNYAFIGCSALERCTIQNILSTYIPTQGFQNCTKLKAIRVANAQTISTQAFYGCSALSVLYLTAASSYSSANIQTYAFANTPILNSSYLGYFGSIYVSASLVDAFKVTPGYSAYADRITAVTDEIKALFEGEIT